MISVAFWLWIHLAQSHMFLVCFFCMTSICSGKLFYSINYSQGITFVAEVANMKFFRLDDSKVLSWLRCKVVFYCLTLVYTIWRRNIICAYHYMKLGFTLFYFYLLLYVNNDITFRLQLDDEMYAVLIYKKLKYFVLILECLACFVFSPHFASKGYKCCALTYN